MPSLTLVLLVTLTSLGAYLLAVLTMGLRGAELRAAALEALDYLGLAALFLIANLLAGVGVILALRALSRQFVSVYILNDATLVILSCLQALVFHCWRMRSK